MEEPKRMRQRIQRRHWIGLAAVTAVALLLLAFFLRTEMAITGGVPGAPLDDAWIHLQFARNLSQGHGFSYNPGDPTPGSTAPLWTLLLAAVALFTDDLLLPALLLSAFFLLLTVWLAYGFAFSLTQQVWAAGLAGLGTAVAGRFLWAGWAGMETTAFAALSVGAVWAYTRRGLRPLPALLFALASQLRPEGHALFALAVADGAWTYFTAGAPREDGRKGALRFFLPPLLIYALVAAPYVFFSLATTGRPLPNTFYAKAGSAAFLSGRTLRETLTYHLLDNPAALVLALFGLLPLWCGRQSPRPSSRTDESRGFCARAFAAFRGSRLTVLWLLGLPLFTAVVIDFTWHHGRYTMPLIPFVMVAAAVGATWLVGRFETRQWTVVGRRLTRLPSPLAALLVALVALGSLWQLNTWAMMLGTNTQEILDIDVALGEWLAANTPPDALVAVDDIGAIAFISQRRIVDMNGLVSPEVWPAVRAPEGLARSQLLTRILSQSRPAYMAAFPLWRWDIVTNAPVAEPLYRVETATHTIIFQPEAAVYAMTWPYLEEATPQNRVDATFGEAIGLLGYDLAVDESLDLTLYWQSETAVDQSYDVFVHVVDAAGDIVAQADRPPVGGLAATDVWQPGDLVRDPLTIALPADLPPGRYEIRVGLYQRESGARLPVRGAAATADALPLATFTWPAP